MTPPRKGGCLNGSAFGDGLEKWNTEDGTVPFLAGNEWIRADSSVPAENGGGALRVEFPDVGMTGSANSDSLERRGTGSV